MKNFLKQGQRIRELEASLNDALRQRDEIFGSRDAVRLENQNLTEEVMRLTTGHREYVETAGEMLRDRDVTIDVLRDQIARLESTTRNQSVEIGKISGLNIDIANLKRDLQVAQDNGRRWERMADDLLQGKQKCIEELTTLKANYETACRTNREALDENARLQHELSQVRAHLLTLTSLFREAATTVAEVEPDSFWEKIKDIFPNHAPVSEGEPTNA